MKKGQISLEYLIVVGFVVFVVIVMTGVAIFYTAGARDRIKTSQLSNFANKIITSAEAVYFAGEPSKVTITAFLPEGVESFEIVQNYLVFNISTNAGTSSIAFPSSVPIDATSVISTSQGVKKIEIAANSQNVKITQI